MRIAPRTMPRSQFKVEKCAAINQDEKATMTIPEIITPNAMMSLTIKAVRGNHSVERFKVPLLCETD